MTQYERDLVRSAAERFAAVVQWIELLNRFAVTHQGKLVGTIHRRNGNYIAVHETTDGNASYHPSAKPEGAVLYLLTQHYE